MVLVLTGVTVASDIYCAKGEGRCDSCGPEVHHPSGNCNYCFSDLPLIPVL
jgi:hypothetical protein